MKYKTHILFLVLFLTLISGCKKKNIIEDDEPFQTNTLTDLLVYPTSMSFEYVGLPEKQQITVKTVPEDASDVSFAWSSTNNSVAGVSETGLVTVTGIGEAQITVTANEQITKKVQVTVKEFRSPGAFRSPVYLQNPATDGMSVYWLTYAPSHSWVEYGTDSLDMQQRAQTVDDGLILANNTANRIRLTGLTPGTRYFYRACSRQVLVYEPYNKVFGATLKGKISSFTTLDNEKTDFTALIFNDLHSEFNRPELIGKLLQQVKDVPYDIVFFNGDCFADVRTELEAIKFLSIFTQAIGGDSIPSVFVRGNHELRGAYSLHLYSLLGKAGGEEHYGAFNIGDTRFVILDFGEDKPDDDPVYGGLNDFSQFRKDMADFTRKEKASEAFLSAARRVLIHHIPLYVNLGQNTSWNDYRVEWQGIFANVPFDISINGHIHVCRHYPKNSSGNDFPIVTGGGPNESNATVLLLRKQGAQMTLTALNVAGETLLSLNL